MAEILKTSKGKSQEKLFVGQLYTKAEQQNEALGHLWLQTMDHEGMDRWQQENPMIVNGIVMVYDPQGQKTYIGTLHQADAPKRDGFTGITLPAAETLNVEVSASHKDGELANQQIFDRLLQALPEAPSKYQYAYITYDDITFDPKAAENQLTVTYLL